MWCLSKTDKSILQSLQPCSGLDLPVITGGTVTSKEQAKLFWSSSFTHSCKKLVFFLCSPPPVPGCETKLFPKGSLFALRVAQRRQFWKSPLSLLSLPPHSNTLEAVLERLHTGGHFDKDSPKARFTQDARRHARANWNVFPLMLLASSVNTPIDNNRSHLLALCLRILCELGLKAFSKRLPLSNNLPEERMFQKGPLSPNFPETSRLFQKVPQTLPVQHRRLFQKAFLSVQQWFILERLPLCNIGGRFLKAPSPFIPWVCFTPHQHHFTLCILHT